MTHAPQLILLSKQVPLPEDPVAAPDCPTVVALPGESILSLNRQLPKLPHKEREQTVAYALEEELAASIDELRFFVGKQDRQGHVTAWVVGLDEWAEYEAQLQGLKLPRIDAIVPDYLCLDFETGSWSVHVDEQRVLLRLSLSTGAAIARPLLLPFLQSLIETHELPSSVHLYAQADAHAGLTANLEQLGLSVICQPDADDSLSAQQALRCPLSMRCEGLAQTKPHKKPLQWAFGLLLTAALVLTGGALLEGHLLKQAQHTADNQLARVFHTLHPGQKPPQQLLSYLSHWQTALNRNLTGEPLLQALGHAATVIHHTPGVSLLGFDAQPHTISLSLKLPKVTLAKTLVSTLATTGWVVSAHTLVKGDILKITLKPETTT